MKIAIDGPAASGKSAAALMLARRLGFIYVDTGAMYRAVTWEGCRRGIDFGREEDIVKTAAGMSIGVLPGGEGDRGYRILVGDRDVTDELFTPEVDGLVSITARVGGVRKILVEMQRALCAGNNVVMAGRDIGSNVLKDAELKVFLAADPLERAKRRRDELARKGRMEELKDILDNIKERDKIDSERKDNPLTRTADAFYLDNSALTVEETVLAIEREARRRMAGS